MDPRSMAALKRQKKKRCSPRDRERSRSRVSVHESGQLIASIRAGRSHRKPLVTFQNRTSFQLLFIAQPGAARLTGPNSCRACRPLELPARPIRPW